MSVWYSVVQKLRITEYLHSRGYEALLWYSVCDSVVQNLLQKTQTPKLKPFNYLIYRHTIAQKERDSFTDEELGKIFKAIKGHPREDIVNIQLYTGMLLSEFLKCKVSEVKGVLCFDLRHVQGKTDYRPRLIPIHPYLLSRGIHERLTDLQRHKSASISHWFMDMLRTHVTKSAKKVNYSLRHTFATKLKAKEVSEEIITELMGHSFASMSLSRYAKEYPIEILKTAIDKLEVM